jgi:Saxitoxin biosynthesis operon protein SxtJ
MDHATLPESALPSDRKFGWTFAALFLLIGTLYHPVLIALAAATALVTLTRAHWLAPAKHAWMKLGELLNRVVSPVVMGLIFFAVFTPVALAMRAMGRDALARRFDPAARSYWIEREPPGPPEDSFRNMF